MDAGKQKPRVLIVDDTPANLQRLGNILKKENLRISFATDGASALSQAETISPDLILLDIMMPGMDGLAVCRNLKTKRATAGIPILFVTAKNGLRDIEEGFEAGGVDYITKPFRERELIARVRTHLTLRRQHAELERLNKEKDILLSVIAHDLRKPFVSYRSGFYLLSQAMEEQDYDECRELGRELQLQTARGEKLLEKLLEWAAIRRAGEDGGPLALREAGNEIAGELSSALTQKTLTFENRVAQDLSLSTHRESLLTILRNLAENALKFSHPGGRITLAAVRVPGALEIRISDTGTGVPPELLARCFSPDSRKSCPGTAGETGAGIGLLLCRELAEQCGGELRLQNNGPEKPDCGATAVLALPEAVIETPPGAQP